MYKERNATIDNKYNETKVSQLIRTDKNSFYKKTVIPLIAGFAMLGMINTSSAANLSNSKPSHYDKQIAAVFIGKNFKKMNVDVVATKTKNTTIDLLNGMTEKGWWYQIGFGYFASKNPKKEGKFGIAFEIFNNKGTSIFPKIGTGMGTFFPEKKGIFNTGDVIQLNIEIVGKKVDMWLVDINDGVQSPKITYSMHGKTFSSGTKKGMFTGIMEESYYNKPTLNFKKEQIFMLPENERGNIIVLSDENKISKNKFTKNIFMLYSGIIKDRNGIILLKNKKIGEEIIIKNNSVFILR